MDWLKNPLTIFVWAIISIGVSIFAYRRAEKVPDHRAKDMLKSESSGFALMLMWGIYLIALFISK